MTKNQRLNCGYSAIAPQKPSPIGQACPLSRRHAEIQPYGCKIYNRPLGMGIGNQKSPMMSGGRSKRRRSKHRRSKHRRSKHRRSKHRRSKRRRSKHRRSKHRRSKHRRSKH